VDENGFSEKFLEQAHDGGMIRPSVKFLESVNRSIRRLINSVAGKILDLVNRFVDYAVH
jgi:hypothetical protein